ncbi:hypothetical protein SELMODRAFT_410164 [Selaginella moellendorffii]|uniref:Uncharacterized protein n=1 Tax=Selaginella moellendorffii TaxID=88036 RepID=D8RDU6_SELML|nr:hypothetical protein SELMODRAFT_410164 [Selaginella moellendorffii]
MVAIENASKFWSCLLLSCILLPSTHTTSYESILSSSSSSGGSKEGGEAIFSDGEHVEFKDNIRDDAVAYMVEESSSDGDQDAEKLIFGLKEIFDFSHIPLKKQS